MLTQVFGVAADYKVAPKTYVRGQVFHRDVDADDANSTLIGSRRGAPFRQGCTCIRKPCNHA